MIRINLLPVRDQVKKEGKRQMFSVAVLSVGLTAAAIAYLWVSQINEIAQMAAQIQSHQDEIKRLQVDTKDVDKYKAEKELLQRRLNIIQTLQQAKTGPVRVLDQLSLSIPGKLWLTALKEKDGLMELKGIAMDNPTIANFMTNLEKTGVINNVELVISQQLERKEWKLKEFTVTCRVQYANPQKEVSGAPPLKESPGKPPQKPAI